MASQKKSAADSTGAQSVLEYRLGRITVEEFHLHRPKIEFKLEDTGNILDFGISPSIATANDNSAVNVGLTIICKVRETQEEFCSISASFLIHCRMVVERVSLQDVLTATPLLKAQLISIAYSTLRGILHERGRGTLLEFEPLPTISPSTFLSPVRIDGVTSVKL